MGDRTPALEATLPVTSRSGAPATSNPPGPDPLLGSTLRHFEVIRLLGRGGMGAVYLGRDTSLDRQVALKVLAPEIGHDGEVVARFIREARAQALLRHPNVAQIYFIGEDRGVHFFAMEYLEGPALDTVLERGERPSWPETVEYAIAAARGLRAALGEGFVHRDLKPSNLVLEKESRVKLIDFGLVKSMRGDSEMTRDGAILGSPLYMAPEQGRAESVDHRSDIYSLGCTLYHLLTGRPPFVAPSPVGVISMHVTDIARPVRTLSPEVPLVLEQAVAKMMAKDPAHRFQDYDTLIAQLEAARPGRREYSGFRYRASALGIDLLLLAIVTRVIGVWAVLVGAVYFVVLHGLLGQTVGKMILRLQVVAADGGRLRWKAAILRFGVSAWGLAAWGGLGAAIFFAYRDDRIAFQLGRLTWRELTAPIAFVSVAGLIFLGWLSGFLMAAFHPRKSALHDLVARTQVVHKIPSTTVAKAVIVSATAQTRK